MTTLTSSVTWTIVLTGIWGALSSIQGLIPTPWGAIVGVIIATLGVYLHKGQIATGKVGRV